MRYKTIVLKCVCLIAFSGYTWFTLDSTVFSRSVSLYYSYKTLPFWSYAAILGGKKSLIKENLLNVALFVPIGFLLYYMFPKKRWWIAYILGLGLSLGIELMQLEWKKGTCEFDDVFHNTIGCIFGYFVASTLMVALKKRNSLYEHESHSLNEYEDNN